MKKILLFFLALCSLNGMAGPISKSDALQNARNFLNARKATGMSKVISIRETPLEETGLSDGFYAFNIADAGGYVIASASDKTQPILGYSDNGAIDPDNMPEALKDWLSNLSHVIGLIESNTVQEKNLTVNDVAAVETKNAIEPLVTSRWNQGDPYNLQTPSYVANGYTYEHSATGCVATAMAQIMYYWKWPQAQTTAIPSYSYNWSGNSRTMPELPPVTFQWDKMTDVYNSSSTAEEKNAVAELMKYVGYSVKMGYGASSGAGVTNTLGAFRDYYDYNPDIYHASQTNYTYREWEDLLYGELAAGRPILMNADNYERTGGHEFVCDGYEDGLFHMNWGWGGYCDGYFVLTVMAPDSQGIGGSNDANGYSMGQGVVINVHPNDGSVDNEVVRLSISNYSCSTTKVLRSTDGSFKLSFSANLHNTLLHSYSIDHAFRICDADGQVVASELAFQSATYNPQNNYTKSASITVESGIADGTYYVKGISRKAGTSEWLPDLHADDYYLVLVISGDEMSVSVYPGQGFDLVVNSLTLEGTSTIDQWQKVVFNITNNGGDFYGETYMFIDGVRSSGNMITIDANETKDIVYKFKVSSLGSHEFILSRTTKTSDAFFSTYKLLNANCYWDAEGNVQELKLSTTVPVAATKDMMAVYFAGSNPSTFSLGDDYNPNMVVYFDEGANVPSRTLTIWRKKISNIVFGNTAEQAKFVDGNSLYIPMQFTAKEASYTRENIPTWSTLVVPFAIQKVSVDDAGIDWFHSAEDEGKSLFIKQESGRRTNTISFNKYIDECEANTPYLIGCAGDLNGSQFNHTGKTVTFSGTDVLVETTDNLKTTTVDTHLVGTYDFSPLQNAYILDADGLNFVKQDDATGNPFHAYLGTSLTNYSSYAVKYLTGEGTSGISPVHSGVDRTDGAVYNLQGIKVGMANDLQTLPRGIYIIGGKKIVK